MEGARRIEAAQSSVAQVDVEQYHNSADLLLVLHRLLRLGCLPPLALAGLRHLLLSSVTLAAQARRPWRSIGPPVALRGVVWPRRWTVPPCMPRSVPKRRGGRA